MSNLNLRNITNSFLDVHLGSLSSWSRAHEFSPHDHGGPYVATQEGYDPEDPTLTPDEFILRRSGEWVSLSLFFQMPEPDRAEFVLVPCLMLVLMLLFTLADSGEQRNLPLITIPAQ